MLGADEEARELWVSVGAPRDSVVPVPGLKENFWAMGETGPCGPCSEIHYDMGPAASDKGHTDCKFGCECGRYVEIWNLVFMQFNRDASGKVDSAPEALDRHRRGPGTPGRRPARQNQQLRYRYICAAHCSAQANLAATRSGGDRQISDASLRIIADQHARRTFLIADGVIPSNEGRGYVLRKIMRRGMRHGRMLGPKSRFLSELAHAVARRRCAAHIPSSIESIEPCDMRDRAGRTAIRAYA